MARTRRLPETPRGAGTVLTDPVDVTTLKDYRVRLTGAEFDDLALRVGLTIEFSLDGGGRWQPIVHAEIVGGSRSKNGELPSVGVSDRIGLGNALVRAALRQDKAASLGLDEDTA